MAIELAAGDARAVILPEWGGRLHQLFIPVDGRPEPLLLAPDDPASYAERPTRGGSFPMAPWPNRVADGRFRWDGRDFALPLDGKPHAIHGRVLSRAWDVTAEAPRTCELMARFDEGWPWRGHAWQRFELRPTSLRMELEVRSDGEPFPAGCGWHPWFRRDAGGATDARLIVPARQRYVLREQIPTGELAQPTGEYRLSGDDPLAGRRLDDCYRGVNGAIRIRWGALTMTMTIDCPEPHVMIYTPPEAVCIEPQTCAPNAFNLANRGVPGTGFALAAPGEPVRIESTWSWEATPRSP